MKKVEEVMANNKDSSSSPKTSKKKLDELLGIPADQNLDAYLDSLTIENESAQIAIDKIDKSVEKELANVDQQISEYANEKSLTKQSESEKLMSIVSIKDSLANVNDLIETSKSIIKHVYNNIICTELIDSELIHAAAAFIESCHLNIKEYIDLYKDRLKFLDKVQFEMIRHRNKMAMLERKYQLESEKKAAEAIDVPADMMQYDQEKIVDALKKLEETGTI